MSAQAWLGLRGRTAERAALDRLLEDVRADHSAVLVVHGEAGVGKTALLRYCIRQAADFRIAHGVGIESEMELPFAGLHQLCAPMLGQLEALPEPQREALSVAFGRASGNRPDRFLIALSVLSLVAEVGAPRRHRRGVRAARLAAGLWAAGGDLQATGGGSLSGGSATPAPGGSGARRGRSADRARRRAARRRPRRGR